MDLATAAKRRKRKKKKARCTPAKRKHHKAAKHSSLDADGGAQEAPPQEAPGLQEEEAPPEAPERHPPRGHPARDAARARARSTCPPATPATEALGHQVADRRLRRSVRLRAGRAAAVARRLRPAARPGRPRWPRWGWRRRVLSLTRPSGAAPMDGPAPTDDGDPLAPYDT